MTDRPSALVPIADEVWAIEDRLRQPGGVILPLRATVVRLPGGEILVHGPTPLRPALLDEVTALGPVRHLVAPSRLHHLSLGPWSVRFPEARLWGAHGLRQKRRDLVFAGELGGGEAGAAGDRAAAPPRPPFADTLQPLLLAGAPALSEVVFFHRPSRSLLCADLLFNIRRPETFSTPVADGYERPPGDEPPVALLHQGPAGAARGARAHARMGLHAPDTRARGGLPGRGRCRWRPRYAGRRSRGAGLGAAVTTVRTAA
jgi:hypothetical protein